MRSITGCLIRELEPHADPHQCEEGVDAIVAQVDANHSTHSQGLGVDDMKGAYEQDCKLSGNGPQDGEQGEAEDKTGQGSQVARPKDK